MKKLYIVIDTETWTNVAVGYDLRDVLDYVRNNIDVYFATDQEFYEDFKARYEIETWEVDEEK